MEEQKEKPPLKKAVVEKMAGLLLAGFALVAALAWNDAVQALFKSIFGDQGSLIAKFGYAIVVTIVITIITLQLAKFTEGEK